MRRNALIRDRIRKMWGKKAMILVIDEDRNLRLVEAMLLPEVYEVILTHDREEALEKVKEIPLDVIWPIS